MPAGPEMDRLVAEKVMGWTARDNRLSGGYLFGWAKPDGSWGACAISGSNAWSPSTDIASAWAVVEKAMASNGCASVQSTGFEWDRRFIARIQFGTCFTTDRSALADTAPLAICRAALMALKLEGK